MHDVAVIGAGPIGSYVAYKLCWMGHSVVVLEQRYNVGEKPCCTGIISRECAEAYSINGDVILRKAKSATFYSPSGKSLRLSRPETQAYIVSRPALDRFMADKARAAGAEYRLESRVENMTSWDGRVTVDTMRDGACSPIDTRAVVIASGFGSPLVKRLGLGSVGNYASGAQAEVNTTGVDEVEVYFGNERSPGFFAWLVPTTPGNGLAGLFSRRSPGDYIRKFLSWLENQGKIASADVAIRYGAVPLKPISRTFAEKVLVVGDAAGQVKPTTGGGIYYGLLCADIAASTLHSALCAGDLSARALSTYEREWRKKLGRELAVDYYARLFYEHLNDKQIERLFNLIKSDGIGETIFNGDLSFDWHADVLLKALKHNTIASAIKLMKLPFALIGM